MEFPAESWFAMGLRSLLKYWHGPRERRWGWMTVARGGSGFHQPRDRRATPADGPIHARPQGCANFWLGQCRRARAGSQRIQPLRALLAQAKNRQQRGPCQYFNRLLNIAIACAWARQCDCFVRSRIGKEAIALTRPGASYRDV